MRSLRQRLILHRDWAMMALMLAIALRALVPQGMMTAPDVGHGVTVLLCDGSGVTGRIDLQLDKKRAPPAHSQACAFGVLAHAASSDSSVGWNTEQNDFPPAEEPPAGVAFALRATANPLPPARGPPVAG